MTKRLCIIVTITHNAEVNLHKYHHFFPDPSLESTVLSKLYSQIYVLHTDKNFRYSYIILT